MGVFLGALLGSFLVMRHQGARSPSVRLAGKDPVEQSRLDALVGLVRVYQKHPYPLQSRYIVQESRQQLDPKHYRRTFLIQGRLKEQSLRVEELCRLEDGSLVRFSLMSPDRVWVTLESGEAADAFFKHIEPWGYHLLRRLDNTKETAYLLGLESNHVDALTTALERLGGLKFVMEAHPDFLGKNFIELSIKNIKSSN